MATSFINSTLESKIVDSKVIESILNNEISHPQLISFVNPFSYSLIARNKRLVDEIDYWFIDGSALCYLTNLRRQKKITRASFDLSSIANDVFNYASKMSLKVAVIGGAPGEVEIACNNLEQIFPNLNIVFKHHGYIKDDFDRVYKEINNSLANYVVVGMGTPIQEEFAIKCKNSCVHLSAIFTCGGFITQTAMKPDYYHPLVKKLGLRWLQRAYHYKHVRDRLIKDYPGFAIRYLINR